MRYILLIAAFLITSFAYGQGTWNKASTNNAWNRTKADSVAIVPRDTSATNNAILPSTGQPVGDYGRIQAKHGLFYFHDSTRNRRMAFYDDITDIGVTAAQLTDSLNTLNLERVTTTSSTANIMSRDLILDAGSGFGRLRFFTANSGMNRLYSMSTGAGAFRPLWIGTGGLVVSDIAGSLVAWDGSSALQVQGKGTFTGDVVRINGSVTNVFSASASAGVIGTTTNHSLGLYTNNLESIRMHRSGASGSILIPSRAGVFPADDAASAAHIKGALKLTRHAATGGVYSHQTFADENASARWEFGTLGTDGVGNSGFDFILRGYDNTGVVIPTTPLYIRRDDGSVGLGTIATAGIRLTVNGNTVGDPAIASNQYVTRQQVSDTIDSRLSAYVPGIPTLQQVTTAGNTTSNTVVIGNHTFGTSRILVNSATDDLSSAVQINGQTRSSGTTAGYSFEDRTTGSSDTWLWYSDNGTSALHKVGGGDRMSITASGNVGIGVTNPLNKFVLPNATGAVAWKNAANTGEDAAIYTDASDRLHLYNGGTIRMSLLTSGDIGIGTTTPSAKLDVEGTGRFASSLKVGNTGNQGFVGLGVGAAFNSGYIEFFRGATPPSRIGYIGFDNDDMNYVAEGSAVHKFITGAATERMRIASNGNVGIGVTNPVTKLDVIGRTYVHPNVIGGAPEPDFFVSNGLTTAGFEIYNDATRAYFGTYENADVGFVNNAGTERVTFKNDGKVGIGTTTPATALEVNGTTTAPRLFSPSGSSLELRAASDYIVMGKGGTGTFTYVDDNGIGVGGLPGGIHTARGYFNGNVVSTDAYVLDGPGGEIAEFYLFGGGAGVRTTTNHPFTFTTNNIERGRFSAAGDLTLVNKLGVGTTSPTSTLHVNGSFAAKIDPTVRTSNFTVGDYMTTIVNNGSGSIAVTLPAASSYPDRIIYLKITGNSNPVTVDGSSVNFSWAPSPNGPLCIFQSNGTNWVALQGM